MKEVIKQAIETVLNKRTSNKVIKVKLVDELANEYSVRRGYWEEIPVHELDMIKEEIINCVNIEIKEDVYEDMDTDDDGRCYTTYQYGYTVKVNFKNK